MMKCNKICSVFGHSDIEQTEDLKNKINLECERLIKEENVGLFYFGGFGNFDDLCWQVVTELKKKYTNIVRIFCLSDPKYQNKLKRPKWLRDEDFEEFVYFDLDFDYWYTRIYYRNCEIINRSDYVIFYVERTTNSGAYKAMKYAIKKKKIIINLYEKSENDLAD